MDYPIFVFLLFVDQDLLQFGSQSVRLGEILDQLLGPEILIIIRHNSDGF